MTDEIQDPKEVIAAGIEKPKVPPAASGKDKTAEKDAASAFVDAEAAVEIDEPTAAELVPLAYHAWQRASANATNVVKRFAKELDLSMEKGGEHRVHIERFLKKAGIEYDFSGYTFTLLPDDADKKTEVLNGETMKKFFDTLLEEAEVAWMHYKLEQDHNIGSLPTEQAVQIAEQTLTQLEMKDRDKLSATAERRYPEDRNNSEILRMALTTYLTAKFAIKPYTPKG